MTLAVTSFKAYGIEVTEPNKTRAIQRAVLKVTGANTDVSWDIAANGGTFWTAAVANTTYGLVAAGALATLQTIDGIADCLSFISGTIPTTYVLGTSTGAGVYTQALSGLRPSITFNTANAPTAATVVLQWELLPLQAAVNAEFNV